VGLKQIGERVQFDIDDVNHGQRSSQKGLSKNLSVPA